MNPENQLLADKIRALAPWHHDIQLTDDFSTGSALGAKTLGREENQGISLISPRDFFFGVLQRIYPNGLAGRTFLDCACNAGAYCFLARELGAERCYGFDVREHWIQQARFVQQHRSIAPVDKIEFHQFDLCDLPKQSLPPFDVVMFKGIFYHLADPIGALKIVADLTREVLVFNSATMDDDEGNSLYCTFESPRPEMSGVQQLAWRPTGARVVAKMLYWAGFRDIRLTYYEKGTGTNPRRGRIECVAAKRDGFLEGLESLPGCRRLAAEQWNRRKRDS